MLDEFEKNLDKPRLVQAATRVRVEQIIRFVTENVADVAAGIVAMLEDVPVVAEEVGDERAALSRVRHLDLQFTTVRLGGQGTSGTAANKLVLRTAKGTQSVVEPVTTLR